MKYFILIFISLNISYAHANECRALFEKQNVVSESEIHNSILDLHSLLRKKFSSDKYERAIAHTLFKQKFDDLARYISPQEIQSRLRKIKSSQTAKKPEIIENKEITQKLKDQSIAEAFAIENGLTLENALFRAVLDQPIGVIKAFIEMGSDVNHKNILFETVLHQAIKVDRPEIIDLLIDHGAEINTSHFASLHHAIRSSSMESLKAIIKRAPDLNFSNDILVGRTAVHIAAATKESIEALEILVQAGADINKADQSLETPLHYAVKNNDALAVKYLLEQGATVNTKNKYGETPLRDSRIKKYSEIEALLLQYGATE